MNLIEFAAEMQRKLDENAHKGGWDRDTFRALIKRLRQEEFVRAFFEDGLDDGKDSSGRRVFRFGARFSIALDTFLAAEKELGR